jgi:DNA-binding response OmpR family regulator
VAVLSAQEYKLLDFLIARAGRIVSRAQLLEGVWGYGDAVDTRTVDVHIAWVRKKIGGEGAGARRIETVRGLGYRFKA